MRSFHIYSFYGSTEIIIPADVSDAQMKKLKEEAKIAARAIDCKGICRVDSFIKADGGEIFINEVNTMPGFTEISMYPKLWEASGISNKELLERIIDYGYEAYKGKSSRNAVPNELFNLSSTNKSLISSMLRSSLQEL